MVPNKIGVGIIGTGRRGYSLGMCIAELSEATDLEIRALCNRTRVRMKETQTALVEKYKQKNHFPSIALYEKYEDLIADSAVDLIMIITPQYVHREHALPALRSGKKVFLDKPIAHNLEDAIAIFQEEQKTHNPMIMGFTRRYEDPWIKTFELVKKGVIGDVHMMLVRNIIPYHTFFHTWHRRMEWSGGALADKMSHFFDVFNWFAESTPERLSAFGSRAVFLPEKNPPNRCRECDRDCPYRVGQKAQTHRQDEMVDFSDSRSKETELVKIHDTCVYLPGADINDHGLVSIVYTIRRDNDEAI
jgi:predicted dehydrogenase